MDDRQRTGASRWAAVVADAEATATDYRDEGWETLELEPTDVTPVPSPRRDEVSDGFGLDVVVTDDAFASLESTVDGRTFDSYEAFRAEADGRLFLVLVVEAPTAETAVVLPLAYDREDAAAMAEAAHDAGVLHVAVRPPGDDRRVVFTQGDPDRLLPDA